MKLGLLFLGLTALSAHARYRHVTDWQRVERRELPPRPSCVVEVKEQIKVEGVLDGKGCLYTWRGEGYPSQCHAPEEVKEGGPAMFKLKPGATLRNLQIECSLDGVVMADDTTIENVIFRDVEEDAVVTRGGRIKIRNNQFWLCQDKCIQLNGPGEDILIENNYFRHALRPMSGSASQGGARGIVARGNVCKNCEIMFRMQRNHDLRASHNSLEDGRDLFETVEEAVIYDCGGNTAKGASYRSRKGTNNVRPCPAISR